MENKKGLVVYFSRKGNNFVGGNIVNLPIGNTKVIANMISDITGSDTFEIETVKEYPLDYTDSTIVAKEELRSDARPELVEYLDDIADYDIIYIGYPNWWGKMPMPVYSFLEKHDFSDKVVMPFCTHEGGGIGDSEIDIKRLCKNAKVINGLSIHGAKVKDAKNIVEEWLKKE